MTPAGMLINKYLEKRDAERLKRENEYQARQQQMEREKEARQLRLSARENLYQQRVNAGTANEFERRVAAAGGFSKINKEELKKAIAGSNQFFTDQNKIDAHNAIIEKNMQEASDSVKAGGPSHRLTGAEYEVFEKSGGKGEYEMNDIDNLQDFGWFDTFTYRGETFINSDKLIPKVKEIGAIATMETRIPNSANLKDRLAWKQNALSFLQKVEDSMHNLHAYNLELKKIRSIWCRQRNRK